MKMKCKKCPHVVTLRGDEKTEVSESDAKIVAEFGGFLVALKHVDGECLHDFEPIPEFS